MKSINSSCTNKSAIIGKNSKIIRLISNEIFGVDLFSHTELELIDFGKYDYVYLFSWDAKDNLNNIENIRKIPGDKLIFISSVCVLSLEVRRQMARYPNDKYAAELECWAHGGRVVRLGVVEREVIEKIYVHYPRTTLKELQNLINRPPKVFPKLVDLYELGIGSPKIKFKKLNDWLYRLSRILPSFLFFQAPLILLSRLLGHKLYGYTRDCCDFFGEECLAGYGVLGQWYYGNAVHKPRVIASPYRDKVILGRGFRGTFLGYDRLGLSKYWHGVRVRTVGSTTIGKKIVPFLKKTDPLPKNALNVHVGGFKASNAGVKLTCNGKKLNSFTSIFRKATFACGPIENTKLALKSLGLKQATFDDHEIGFFGFVLKQELKKKKLIKTLGPFVTGRNVVLFEHKDLKFMADFRPDNGSTYNIDDAKFYLGSTSNIIKKLASRLSFWRINEAIYNKFGIAVSTRRFSIFCQILTYKAISLKHTGEMKRNRLEKSDIRLVCDRIGSKFVSFEPIKEIETFDGQHLVCRLNSVDLLSNYRGNFSFLGSPSTFRLTSTHHTLDMIDYFERLRSDNE